MPDGAIFADIQAEPASVYKWLDWLETQLPFPLYRVTKGSLSEAALALRERAERAEAEVERLEANLKRAIEIAERLRSKIFTDGWLDEDDELYQIKATLNPTDK
jgi:DNA-binding transcriptional LysR family regulator